MKKVFVSVIFLSLFLIRTSFVSAAYSIPVSQAIIYRPQTVSLDNFGVAIVAQGQLSSVAALPNSSKILYFDVDKVLGPSILSPNQSCPATTSYYQDTISLDKHFCPDFHSAIASGSPIYGLVPTEDVFLHKPNGARCAYVTDGGTYYMINPASNFYKNYFVNRAREKLIEHGLTKLFLDDLQNGWKVVTNSCGGAIPAEYTSWSLYDQQMTELARYIKNKLPNYFITGNLANANSEVWNRYTFLDGAMCESCLSDWGGAWPSSTKMISTLAILNKWVNQDGKDIYVVVMAPNTLNSSNLFTFSASLLVAKGSGDNVFFHFGVPNDNNVFHNIPEYKYDIGLPVSPYVCSGSVCSRNFQRASVRVDFANHTGSVTINSPSSSPSSYKTGDVNRDGDVNVIDIGITIDNYGQSTSRYPNADINGDGIINLVDIGLIIDNYF